MNRQYWISSKPIYSVLRWHDKASGHVVIAAGDGGGMAVLKLLQQRYPSQPVRGFYVQSDQADKDYSDIITCLTDNEFTMFNNVASALSALKTILPDCRMGSQFYVAGDEQFIWLVAKTLVHVGVQDDDIVKELCDTLARPVYCVHCQVITQNVRDNITPCSGCQRYLFVRDHFSRRLGAYMGIMVDSEQPGDIPDIQEVYP